MVLLEQFFFTVSYWIFFFPAPVPIFSPPTVWGRRAGVPSRGDPSPCRRSPVKPECRERSPPTSPLHPPTPCARPGGAGAGPRRASGEERVEGWRGARVAAWGRGRGRGRNGPAPGPGSRVTPACRHSGEFFFVLFWRIGGDQVINSESPRAEDAASVVTPRSAGTKQVGNSVRAQRRCGAKNPGQNDVWTLLLA